MDKKSCTKIRFYDLDVLSDLTNQLALTNWFKSITSKNIISLDTILIPTAKNKLEIALGYSANKRWHIKGIGCGIRWISQFGPIKIDIAKPIFASKNDRLEFYIGLGSEL
ncbi:hypothetical protein GQX74_015788 [Glossina fuscipes]|nr:hypothetical protein GQX74_015788 [Glossina fuscipes]